LSAENTSVTIVVIGGVSGETDTVYGEPTDILNLGASYVDGLQANSDNYVLFVPQVDGIYRFTAQNSAAKLSYWGNNTNFLVNLTDTTDYDSSTNSLTINIKPGHLGSNFVFGLTGDTEAVVVIERIGDAILDVTDMEEIPYERTNDLEKNFTLKIPSGKKLTYIDMFGETVTYHKGSDGYYHLNSENGPILYVNLGDSAPYLSMSKCMGVTDEHAVYKLVYVYYDDNGNPIEKVSYNACMTEYVYSICPNTDVYPLNDDLVFILQQSSAVKGWGDYESYDYLFYDANGEKVPGANEQIAWMYACCYIE